MVKATDSPVTISSVPLKIPYILKCVDGCSLKRGGSGWSLPNLRSVSIKKAIYFSKWIQYRQYWFIVNKHLNTENNSTLCFEDKNILIK